MRQIHVELDEAVMDAYGWADVPLEHGFHTYRQMTRWTVSPAARVEILDRLLEENLRRAAAQQPKAATKAAARRRRPMSRRRAGDAAVTDPAPGIRLAHEPDGTSCTVRENLVDILERELLGPIGRTGGAAGGEPASLYLVGHIAPVKLTEPRC